MNFHYYAHVDEPMQNSVNFYSNEFDSLAETCRDLLDYEISRRIFDDKLDFVHSFVDRFKKESEGEFYIEI